MIKSDRRVILALSAVAAAALLVATLAEQPQPAPQPAATTKPRRAPARHHRHYYYAQRQAEAEPFGFDPNTADSTQLLRLGLRPLQVRNIYRYRAAGGVFRQPADFARLYGMTRQQYERLKPHIRIDQQWIDDHDERYFYNYEPIEERDTLLYPIKLKPEERVVLNTADTLQLRKVPGVGHHFASQILSYRQRLGGYYRVQQLLEIPDFPESAVGFFIIPDDGPPLRKLNVNRLSLNELKKHPYINFYQARDIVDYRRLHGPLKSLQQLGLSPDFTPEAIERLEPYVEY